MQLTFQAKEPGPLVCLSPVDLHFFYKETFHKDPPEAYETLLYDVMIGDQMLFMRADQVEAAWSVVMPILEGLAKNSPPNFPNYPCGAWGPEAAEELIMKDGRSWFVPLQILEDEKEIVKPE